MFITKLTKAQSLSLVRNMSQINSFVIHIPFFYLKSNEMGELENHVGQKINVTAVWWGRSRKKTTRKA